MEKNKLLEAFLGAPGTFTGSEHGFGSKIKQDPTLGNNLSRPIYLYEDEDESEDLDSEDDLETTLMGVNIDSMSPRHRIDLGSGSPHNADYGHSMPVNAGVNENHTTTAMKGVNPNMSRDSKGKRVNKSTGLGPTGVKFYTGPYKRTGTHFGNSRAPKPHNIEHELSNKFSIHDFKITKDDLMGLSFEREFNKHQNKIKNLLKEVYYIF